ncbi:MAG: hypothetical protein KJ927_13190 [Candidatus Eisenbacteria bacterium]|nr:hypothetical protein [Candidatus Eisenbacteria bacterium]
MRTLLLILALCVVSSVAAGAHDEFWCWDADEILAEIDGGRVTIQHLSDLINCCPDPITYDVSVGDATIMVEEHSLSMCYCLCCFNLSVTLEEVPPVRGICSTAGLTLKPTTGQSVFYKSMFPMWDRDTSRSSRCRIPKDALNRRRRRERDRNPSP